MSNDPGNAAGGVAFVGDSITAAGRWDAMFPQIRSRNFGIDGERTVHILERLGPVIAFAPARVFLMIGTNDLGHGEQEDIIVANAARIFEQLRTALPACRFYLYSVLPRQPEYAARVLSLNRRYRQLAAEQQLIYIDLYPLYDDGKGSLRPDLTYDALHLSQAGYEVWREALASYLS